MHDVTADAVATAKAAAERAEKAANRVEEATKRVGVLVIIGFAIALLGAVLVFTLDDSEATLLDSVRWQPLGGVLLAAGALLMLGAVIGMIGGGGDGVSLDSIRTVGGLIAVVAALIAVTALTIYTLSQLDSSKENTVVGVTSSAFGIISAVVGAYLGIKITADSSRDAKKMTEAQRDVEIAKQDAAQARQDADAAHGHVDLATEIDQMEIKSEDAAKLKELLKRSRRKPPDPAPGTGKA